MKSHVMFNPLSFFNLFIVYNSSIKKLLSNLAKDKPFTTLKELSHKQFRGVSLDQNRLPLLPCLIAFAFSSERCRNLISKIYNR